MSEKSAASASNGKHWLLLLALIIISVGLWHYFDVPFKKTVGAAAFLLVLYLFYFLYQFSRAEKRAKAQMTATLARIREQERELYDYAKANGLDLPQPSPMQTHVENTEPVLLPLKLKERFWVLVCIPFLSVIGYGATSMALHNLGLGVLTYKKQGYPPATITVTAAENAVEFYIQVAFTGSLGIFMLTMCIATLLMLPAVLLPSIDVAYRTRLRPWIKWPVYLGLPFGIVFILLLMLRPLLL